MPEIQTGLREPQPVCSRIHAVGGDVRLLGGRALVEREHAGDDPRKSCGVARPVRSVRARRKHTDT